jgi:hypothetical protein
MLEGISTPALLIYVSLLVVALIALTLLVLLVHSGLFRTVEEVGTGKPPIGQVVIAYKFQKGPYNSSGQIFTEAAIIAPTNKALGIYYDDPDKVDSNETRYLVGSVLSENSLPVCEDMVKRFTDKDFKVTTLPEVTFAVKTSFPHITTLSILIAVHKVYPRLKDYIQEKQLSAFPFIEIYDGKTIHFMAPLYKQDEFYVPECTQTGDGDQGSPDEDRTIPNTSLSEAGEPGDISSVNDEPCESDDITSTFGREEPHESHGVSLTTDLDETHKRHDSCSAKDHVEADESQDLSSCPDGSQESHELDSVKDCGDSLPPIVQKDQTDDAQPAVNAEDGDVADENNVNNNFMEVSEEERSNDDEQASDDSSSSFEVLKEEPAD